MNSNKIALLLLSWIKDFLIYLGFNENIINKLDEFIFLIFLIVIASIIGTIVHLIIFHFFNHIIKRRKVALLQELLHFNALKKISALTPAFIITALLPFGLETSSQWYMISDKVTWIYFFIMLILSISAVANAIISLVVKDEKWQNKPIKIIVELLKIICIVIVIIVLISLLINKSPLNLITGLGAFAAVIMLIFKDTIVGFVSGVLLSENDMIHIGDWIEIPETSVNGTVQDITLDTVKIRRFDNTIITVPPYTLISQPFINWIGMTESGGRRIMSNYNIKLDYVKKCSDEFLEKMKAFDKELNNYITSKQQQKAAGKECNTENQDGLVDGTIDTNLGLLRAYLVMYIKRHPFINKDLFFMVHTLDPTENGIPLQIYCFSANKNWASYESIRSEIMEHFVYVLPIFDLFPFQNAGSRDYIVSACIESNKYNRDNLNGIPLNTFKDMHNITDMSKKN